MKNNLFVNVVWHQQQYKNPFETKNRIKINNKCRRSLETTIKAYGAKKGTCLSNIIWLTKKASSNFGILKSIALYIVLPSGYPMNDK
jgi:hypothetical protein